MTQQSKASFIYIDLKKRITSGEFDHYQILPTEKKLEAYYAASRNTVRKAIRQLNSDGLVYSKVGSSNVVLKQINIANVLIDSGNSHRPSKITNQNISTHIVSFEKKTVSKSLAKISTFDEGADYFHVVRLRNIDEQPTMIDNSHFLCSVMPNLTEKIASSSIYDYLQNELGIKIVGSKLVDRIIEANTLDTMYLNLSDNSTVGLTQSWSYLDTGNIFEYTEIHFSPESYVRTRFVSQ